MATYPGMSLGGEVRDSVSLDEDDLSDVEDEVFIRDGKSGYKVSNLLQFKAFVIFLLNGDFNSSLKTQG